MNMENYRRMVKLIINKKRKSLWTWKNIITTSVNERTQWKDSGLSEKKELKSIHSTVNPGNLVGRLYKRLRPLVRLN